VIEIFTAKTPFYQYREHTVVLKTLKGERPERPPNSLDLGLTDTVWGMVQACWDCKPAERPTIQRFAITVR